MIIVTLQVPNMNVVVSSFNFFLSEFSASLLRLLRAPAILKLLHKSGTVGAFIQACTVVAVPVLYNGVRQTLGQFISTMTLVWNKLTFKSREFNVWRFIDETRKLYLFKAKDLIKFLGVDRKVVVRLVPEHCKYKLSDVVPFNLSARWHPDTVMINEEGIGYLAKDQPDFLRFIRLLCWCGTRFYIRVVIHLDTPDTYIFIRSKRSVGERLIGPFKVLLEQEVAVSPTSLNLCALVKEKLYAYGVEYKSEKYVIETKCNVVKLVEEINVEI